ncbi:MAG: hypothetical protein KAT46_00480 [Deltaproteobacteria bacterium]|nr:hypothetical protein [Deltaproteobacteria bacterium]
MSFEEGSSNTVYPSKTRYAVFDKYNTSTLELELTKPAPPNGCEIELEVKPPDDNDTSSNGGHNHSSNRLVGKLSNKKVTFTGSEVGPKKIKYVSGEVSGVETIVAKVAKEDYTSEQKMRVMVPYLVSLERETDTYVLKQAGVETVNCSTNYHGDCYSMNKWIKPFFERIAVQYRSAFPKDNRIVLTDGSLPWGGAYSIYSNWGSLGNKHTYHRIGTDLDIRSKIHGDKFGNGVKKKKNRRMFEEIVCRNHGYPDLEKVGTVYEHYHIYFWPYRAKHSNICSDILKEKK